MEFFESTSELDTNMQYVDLSKSTKEYLAAFSFLRNFNHSVALKTALKTGLIEELTTNGKASESAIGKFLRLDEHGSRLLLSQLQEAKVINISDSVITLNPEFSAVARFSEFMESIIDYVTAFSTNYCQSHLNLVTNSLNLLQDTPYSQIFTYAKRAQNVQSDIDATQRWMKITTELTRHETPALIELVDFRNTRKLLDVGGNSGECCAQLTAKYPKMLACVFDLPEVCEVVKRNLNLNPSSSTQIQFESGNFLVDELPGPFDTVLLKSTLHDWPIDKTLLILKKAIKSLDSGGKLVIFERSVLAADAPVSAFFMIPNLLFSRWFRKPDVYEKMLIACGLKIISIRYFQLETDFFVLEAHKP